MIEVMKNIFNDERIIFLSGKELEINNGNIFNWKRWNGIIEDLIIEGRKDLLSEIKEKGRVLVSILK